MHNADVTRQTVVGKVGTVIHAIRGGELAGEAKVVVDGIAHYYLAYSADPQPAGTVVLVINNRGARQIDVEPWPAGMDCPPAADPTVPPDSLPGGDVEGH